MENNLIVIGNKGTILTEKEVKSAFRILYILLFFSLVIMALAINYMYQDYSYKKDIDNIFNESIFTQTKEIEAVKETVRNLPTKVIDVLKDNDVRISYSNWEPQSGAAGIFYPLNGLIVAHYIKENDSSLILKYHSKLVTLHEIGHAFDTDYSRKLVGYSYSGTDEFDEIYKEEVSNLNSTEVFYNVGQSWLDYHSNSRYEYFAERFALYFANGETKEILKTYAPKTYNYISYSVMSSNEYTFSNFIKGIFD